MRFRNKDIPHTFLTLHFAASYYRSAKGALLVYDITNRDTYAKIPGWLKQLRDMLGSKVDVGLVGQKSDLQHLRAVPAEEAEAFASQSV